MSYRNLLQVLEYPDWSTVDVQERGNQASLLLWLEDRKIREFSIADREGLRISPSETGAERWRVWGQAVKDYLVTLGCPHDWDEEPVDCVLWAVQYAIYVEYEECAESCTNIESSSGVNSNSMDASSSSSSAAGGGGRGNYDDDEALDAASIDELGGRLAESRLPGEPNADYLHRLAKIIRFQVVPCLAESGGSEMDVSGGASASASGSSSSSGGGNSSNNNSSNIDISEFPLGFDTGDASVNKVALVLKMMYISDLRDLQNDLNGLISLGQEYTANPKTNTKLGKVGR
jgi:RLL motif-containing protein 1